MVRDRKVSKSVYGANPFQFDENGGDVKLGKMSINKTLFTEMFEDLLKRIDDDGSGQIEYQEFLAHAIGKKQLSKKNLRSFFNVIIPIDQLLSPEEYGITDSSSSNSDDMEGNENIEIFLP